MPNISDIIFCLRATNNDGEGACATTILSSISPEYVPGLFTFSVIINLLDVDTSVEHKLSIDFVDPNEENTIHIEGPVPTFVDDSNLPKEHKGVTVAMDWNNVNFKMSGLYTIKIYIDDELIQTKSIYVKGKNE